MAGGNGHSRHDDDDDDEIEFPMERPELPPMREFVVTLEKSQEHESGLLHMSAHGTDYSPVGDLIFVHYRTTQVKPGQWGITPYHVRQINHRIWREVEEIPIPTTNGKLH